MEYPIVGTATGAALQVDAGNSQVPLDTRHAYTEFRQTPLCGAKLGGGAATGTTGDVNVMIVPGLGAHPGVGFEYTVLGAGQTIVAPALTDNGLNISLDQANDEGVEIDTGINARNPLIFTVGTDACYLKVAAKVADASGADPLLVGFRTVAARAADHNDYTDFAGIGLYAGDIKTETALNNAATVATDTTDNWEDNAEHTLEVYVSKAGAVTYRVDGEEPTTTVAYSFDAGDTIMPFLRFLHGADIAGAVELSLFDCGLQ